MRWTHDFVTLPGVSDARRLQAGRAGGIVRPMSGERKYFISNVLVWSEAVKRFTAARER